MAFFMLNDRPHLSHEGWNTLEKITHQLHMHEIYTAAAPIYKRMKESSTTDPEICACVNDIEGNGILGELGRIAEELKNHFQTPFKNGRAVARYYGRRKRNADEADFDWAKILTKVSELEKEYLANPTVETADRLLDARPWKANTLVSRYL